MLGLKIILRSGTLAYEREREKLYLLPSHRAPLTDEGDTTTKDKFQESSSYLQNVGKGLLTQV